MAAGGVAGRPPERDGGVLVERAPCCPVGVVVGGRDDGWLAGVELGGVPVGREEPGVVGGLDVRLLPRAALGWFVWLGVELFTVGVLDDRDAGPGVADRGVELLEPVVGALDVRDDLVGVELGVAVLELLGPRGVDLLSSPLPDWRRLAAFDWSVARARCAVALTFCPVVSVAVAARSAPSRAVLMASSALPMATWPNTPALCDEAPMLSMPPTPSRIWLPRPENRLLIDSTPSGSMAEP